jgi:hypothetical protein
VADVILDRDPGDETRHRGDLCELCGVDLAAPNDDWCRACIEAIEPLVWEAEKKKREADRAASEALNDLALLNEWLNGSEAE